MKAILKFKSILLVLFVIIHSAYGQSDTLKVKQGDRLIGEIIKLDENILSFKTAYSPDILSINWNDVVLLIGSKRYKISNSNGLVVLGRLKIDTNQKVPIAYIFNGRDTLRIKKTDLVSINRFEKKLSDRLKISADLGFIFTKDNNSKQASFDLNLKYLARLWEFNLDYYGFASTVDTISNQRANLGLSVRYNLPGNWFLLSSVGSFLSTEQAIDSRVNYLIGGGKYLIKHEKFTFWGYAGATYNKEKFTNNPQLFKSAEAFWGVHLDSKLLGKVNINSDLVLYPSLSERGRLRIYSKTDATVNIVKHFRFGLGYVFNGDTKPPVSASKSDYIFNAKIGWSL